MFRISLIFFCFLFTTPFIYAQELEIIKINFKGNSTFSYGELEDIIHSKEDDDFDIRLVKLDKILLTNFYRKQGYLMASVSDSLVINKVEKHVSILFKITEGRKYILKNIIFFGNNRITNEQFQVIFTEIISDSTFEEGIIHSGKQQMENIYYNSGMPFVEINPEYIFEQDSLVTVNFFIKENQKVFIKDINYSGLKLVKEFLIRRELEFQKNELYNREKLGASQQNIYSTGLFDYVRFEIEPIEGDSTNVNLNILVQERDPRWIGARIGFAYEQEESYGNKLELTAEGGHRNLFGTARSISLHVVPSFWFDLNENKIHNPENQVSLVFVEPWIGYTRTPGVFQASYHQYRPLATADFDVTRFSFNLSHKYKNNLDLSGSIETKFVKQLEEGVIDTTKEADAGKDQIYSISLYSRRDTRDNFFNPTNGSLTDLSLSYSYTIGKTKTGTEDIKQYFTLVSSWSRYQPIRYNIFKKRGAITLASRIKAGAIFELGKTKSIPISDLFFIGGATTVRGYEEQLLGPATLDSTGFKDKAIGGKILFLANAEIRIPLFWMFVGEIFADAGNVWREIDQIRPAQIKFTAGLGIALITPIGPIRLDYGIKLDKEKSDRKRTEYHVGVYFAF